MNKSYNDILDSAASLHIPDDLNLFPHVEAKLNQRRTFMQTLRARPALAIMLAILALILLTGVAYAIGRSLGYIPGAGIVEQGAQIRVLAEPISVKRDGITLTVEQAILTPDQTLIVYKVEGIPAEARPKGEGGFACHPATPTLLLPDGTELSINGGNGSGWGSGYQSGFNYPPIPADVNIAKFFLPCLEDVAPATAPQDWQLTLRFVPAPPDLTIVPIIEVATPLPTPTAPASVSLAESTPFMGLTYHLESMKRTDQGYTIETSIRWDEGLYADYGVGTGADITLTDANGKAIDLHWLQDEKYRIPVEPRRGLMGYSLDDVPFIAPLTLTLPWVGANLPLDNRPQFTFDPGPNPQPGQEWQINQTIDVVGHPVEILSARYVTREDLQATDWIRFLPEEIYGFEFTLEADAVFRTIALSVDAGYSADGGGTSGIPTIRDENGIIKAYAMMGGEIISPLTIIVPYIDIAHPWQITFDPADIVTGIPTPSASTLEASLQIEKIIPTEDGYYLIGRTNWNDPGLSEVGMGGWNTKLLDAKGIEYPIEPAYFDEIGITDVQPGQWALKVYGKAFPESLTLRMAQANVQFVQPYTFTFDPGANPQLGQEWQTNQSLEILGHKATVVSAKFIQQGDLHGFEFSLTADPVFQEIPLGIESGVISGNRGGGGSSPRDENGLMKVYVLSDGQFNSPLAMGIRSAVLNGDWETTWIPPAAEARATPVSLPQACVTLDKWKQAAGSPEAMPSEVEGKILVSVNESSHLPTIYISTLDGTNSQRIDTGTWPSLSRDGVHLAYSAADGLHILDLSTGSNTALGMDGYQIIWSPDNTRMMYTTTFSLYVVNADGSSLQSVDIGSSGVVSSVGWLPDNRTIVYGALGEEGFTLTTYNLQSRETKTLFIVRNKAGTASISPDGAWIAYLDKVIGKMSPGIFVSRLDGSEKRLLVQLEHWMANTPVWSPDGRWLALTVMDTDQFQPTSVPALVNLESCQIVPLSSIRGSVEGWSP